MRPIKMVLALLLALHASAAMALGLGDIRVLSRPGQALLAEIPVISADPGELENARVALASPATFERVGLAAPQGLVGELQFQFAQDSQGRAVIRVTSATPVAVPSLSFLIEVDWGQGRLVREYSALVAAPETATALSEPLIEAPQAAPSDRIIREPAPIDESAAMPPATAAPPPTPKATAAAAPAPVPARPAVVAAADGVLATVRRGQTLSQIAGQLARDSGQGLEQAMVALLQANPEAFIRGNMHLLKQGAVLRSPGQEALAQVDAAQARAIVQQQTAQWRQARAPIPQPANADAAVAGTPAATAVSGARLEIAPAVAANDNRAGTTSGLEAGGEGDMLANEQLRQAREDLATRDGELQDLRDRVAELEKLQQQQQALIAMKDTDLAAAQKRLAEAGAGESAATPVWLWLAGVLLVLAAVAWAVSRRRKPSPLPRRDFDSAELAASMAPAAAVMAVDAPADASEAGPVLAAEPTPEEGHEEMPLWAQSRPRGEADAAADPARAPVLLFEASRTPSDTAEVAPAADEGEDEVMPTDTDTAPEIDTGAEHYVTDEAGQWHQAPTPRAPLHPAPAARERLELAIAYMDLGDAETARTLLDEVLHGGDAQARSEAAELLERLR